MSRNHATKLSAQCYSTRDLPVSSRNPADATSDLVQRTLLDRGIFDGARSHFRATNARHCIPEDFKRPTSLGFLSSNSVLLSPKNGYSPKVQNKSNEDTALANLPSERWAYSVNLDHHMSSSAQSRL